MMNQSIIYLKNTLIPFDCRKPKNLAVSIQLKLTGFPNQFECYLDQHYARKGKTSQFLPALNYIDILVKSEQICTKRNLRRTFHLNFKCRCQKSKCISCFREKPTNITVFSIT